MVDEIERFVGGSYGYYDRYKDERLLWSEWEDNVRIMNNLNKKARENGKALSTVQKKLDKVNNENKILKEDLRLVLPILLAIDFKLSINECKAINRLCEYLNDDFIKGKECEDL